MLLPVYLPDDRKAAGDLWEDHNMGTDLVHVLQYRGVLYGTGALWRAAGRHAGGRGMAGLDRRALWGRKGGADLSQRGPGGIKVKIIETVLT